MEQVIGGRVVNSYVDGFFGPVRGEWLAKSGEWRDAGRFRNETRAWIAGAQMASVPQADIIGWASK